MPNVVSAWENGGEKNFARFFLQWPEFVMRNRAGLGWRSGMVLENSNPS